MRVSVHVFVCVLTFSIYLSTKKSKRAFFWVGELIEIISVWVVSWKSYESSVGVNRHVRKPKANSLRLLWPSSILLVVFLISVDSCCKKKINYLTPEVMPGGDHLSVNLYPDFPLHASELTSSFYSFQQKSIGFGIIWYFLFSLNVQNKLCGHLLEPKHGLRVNYKPGCAVL